jgi:16S rRNA (cytosine967-C5)-methyltransferase
MELHHNLPQWLVEPLKEQLGNDFWPLRSSTRLLAGMRVNTSRTTMRAGRGLENRHRPYFNLRLAETNHSWQTDAFTRGAIEAGRRSLVAGALLADLPRRDGGGLCAGAGGKTGWGTTQHRAFT